MCQPVSSSFSVSGEILANMMNALISIILRGKSMDFFFLYQSCLEVRAHGSFLQTQIQTDCKAYKVGDVAK